VKMLELVRRYAPGRMATILFLSSIGGLLAGGTVAVANWATATSGRASLSSGFVFLLVLAVMYGTQRAAASRIVVAFEDVQRGLRDDLSRAMARSPLRAVETLDARLSRTAGELSYFSSTIEAWASGLQHIVFLVALTLIVGTISGKALLIWTLGVGIGFWRLVPGIRAFRQTGKALGQATGALGKRVEHLLDGFVQVKLDGELSRQVVADMLEATDTVYDRQVTLQQLGVATFTGTFLIIYAFTWGPAAFADADGIGLGPVLGYELVTLVQQGLGPIFGLSAAIPDWARAEAAAAGIVEVLEAIPEEAGAAAPLPADGPPPFDRIELVDAGFAYGGGFRVGPIDLTIERGDFILVTGGNGSGKTTLMKMLMGLYPLSRGSLNVDGRPVDTTARGAYRNRFTAILSGQHLFKQLYGLRQTVEPDRVDALLERFGIEFMVGYADGVFDTLALSTGQRMRLAMVVALLEDRPICVFDEWTANQDPETTRFYYDTVLPELKAQGKTIIAVSHDDRYFARADRTIAIDAGRMVDDVVAVARGLPPADDDSSEDP